MKRKVISISLIALLLLQASNLAVIYGYYALEKSYITEQYCINKTVQITCSGKCFIDNWVDLTDQDSDTTTPPNLEDLPIFSPFLLDTSTLTLAPPNLVGHNKCFTSYNFFYNFHFLQSSYQPPEMA